MIEIVKASFFGVRLTGAFSHVDTFQVEWTASPPVIVVSKPKVYLTCRIHIPANHWVNLSA